MNTAPPQPGPVVRRGRRGEGWGGDGWGGDGRSGSTRGHGRGTGFAWACLIGAVVASVVLYVAGYGAFDSIDLTSADPVGTASGMLVLAGIAAIFALIMFVLAVIATVTNRPRTVAVLALATSVVLPVIAVVTAVTFGVQALYESVSEDVSKVSAAASRLIALLESWGVPMGPLHEVTNAISGG